MSEIILTRKQLADKAKEESDKADLKQHADKLILGFENSNSLDAKRALWELVQNARDLSSKAIIEVNMESHQFSFTHYGKTFDSNTLLCLVKQVSSKTRKKQDQKGDADEVKEVGQYGTGFITTHSFGKRFLLDGTIELQKEEFVELTSFEVDRIAKDSDELTDKLLRQQNAVFHIVENGTPISSSLPTTFRYQFTMPVEVRNAEIAISKITESFIPQVMALNGNIFSISITNKLITPNHSYTYKKGQSYLEGDLTIVPVQKDDYPPVKLFVLPVNQDLDLKIILPLSDSLTAMPLLPSMSRLFLYFPLIGTEELGCNFIIHCGLFHPHEKRDGIWIASDNPQNKEKETCNQVILQMASDAIFAFMEKNAKTIANPIHLAPISFPILSNNSLVDDYFKGLKIQWVTKFRAYELVETTTERIKVEEAHFLAAELLLEKNTSDAIYDLAAAFWNRLPKKSLSEAWTNIIKSWDDEKTKWISIRDICGKIQESTHGSINVQLLQTFYGYLLRNNHHKYFDDFRLLPTYNNKYAVKAGLFKSAPLHDLFIEMARTFTPKVPNQLVQDDFILLQSFNDYTRAELSKQLNPVLREISLKLKVGNLLNDLQKALLIKFCNSFPLLENKGVRGELMSLIKSFYQINAEPLQIPNAGEDKIDYSIASECLVRHIIYDFATHASKDKDWVKNNLSIIKQLVVVLTTNKEYSGLLTDMPIFVNQNLTLIAREISLIQKDIPEALKTLYYSIFKKDKNDFLLLEEFVPFLKDGKNLEGKQVALEISNFIDGHGDIEKINQHPDSKIILNIIKRISDPNQKDEWTKLFPAIAASRTTIVTARVVKEEVKENIFSILTLEDDAKIALLGDLARDKDMSVIIEYGKQMLHDTASKQFDFDLKYKIGKHIENLLRDNINENLQVLDLKVEVLDEQKGKDIVIRKGDKTLYYIEVKSRWRSEYSIRMSKTQAETAVTHPNTYALLGISMVDYKPDDGSRHEPQELTAIVDRITVLDNIGQIVEPLIQNAMKKNRIDEDVHISPDYTIVVPQVVFKTEGIGFDQFMKNLVIYLQKVLIQ
jgi:hypothetical protein